MLDKRRGLHAKSGALLRCESSKRGPCRHCAGARLSIGGLMPREPNIHHALDTAGIAGVVEQVDLQKEWGLMAAQLAQSCVVDVGMQNSQENRFSALLGTEKYIGVLETRWVAGAFFLLHAHFGAVTAGRSRGRVDSSDHVCICAPARWICHANCLEQMPPRSCRFCTREEKACEECISNVVARKVVRTNH